jgi:hypothetical protein
MAQAGLDSGDGLVWAQLWYNGTEQFYCKGSECSQTVANGSGSVNSSTWTCPELSCVCRTGAEFCGSSYLVSLIVVEHPRHAADTVIGLVAQLDRRDQYSQGPAGD